MKFLIVLTVAAACVLSSEAFLFGKGKGESSGQAYSSSQSSGQAQGYAYEAPVQTQSSGSSASSSGFASGHGGLGGGFDISSLLQIPIQLKMKLLEAKKNKIQALIGKFSSFGGSSSGAGANSISSSNAYSGAAEGGVQSYQQQAPAQSYHPQPAPAQNYQQQPLVLHLYQIENQQQQQQQQHSQSNSVASSYAAPSTSYGPPNHQPAAPISSAQVSSQGVDSSYLPPHSNCQDNSHYH